MAVLGGAGCESRAGQQLGREGGPQAVLLGLGLMFKDLLGNLQSNLATVWGCTWVFLELILQHVQIY